MRNVHEGVADALAGSRLDVQAQVLPGERADSELVLVLLRGRSRRDEGGHREGQHGEAEHGLGYLVSMVWEMCMRPCAFM